MANGKPSNLLKSLASASASAAASASETLWPGLNVLLAAVWGRISRILCYCKHQITDSKTLTHSPRSRTRIRIGYIETRSTGSRIPHTHTHININVNVNINRGREESGPKCVWANVLFGHAGRAISRPIPPARAFHSNRSIRQSPSVVVDAL